MWRASAKIVVFRFLFVHFSPFPFVLFRWERVKRGKGGAETARRRERASQEAPARKRHEIARKAENQKKQKRPAPHSPRHLHTQPRLARTSTHTCCSWRGERAEERYEEEQKVDNEEEEENKCLRRQHRSSAISEYHCKSKHTRIGEGGVNDGRG